MNQRMMVFLKIFLRKKTFKKNYVANKKSEKADNN